MKKYILCLILFSFASCNMKKVTEVTITNQNLYPITIIITTNNVTQKFTSIKPNEKFVGIYDWTQLNNQDGAWLFDIINESNNQSDEFRHGYFTNGELANYATLICKGDQLKVQISE